MTAKQTPFHDVGMEAGAEMQELFGYWLPWQYERGHVEEHLATRNRVSICDLDYMAEFRIVGPAAFSSHRSCSRMTSAIWALAEFGTRRCATSRETWSTMELCGDWRQ